MSLCLPAILPQHTHPPCLHTLAHTAGRPRNDPSRNTETPRSARKRPHNSSDNEEEEEVEEEEEEEEEEGEGAAPRRAARGGGKQGSQRGGGKQDPTAYTPSKHPFHGITRERCWGGGP